MDFYNIIGIILFFLVGVWFLYELIAFIRMIVRRIRLKKSDKSVAKDDDDINGDNLK